MISYGDLRTEDRRRAGSITGVLPSEIINARTGPGSPMDYDHGFASYAISGRCDEPGAGWCGDSMHCAVPTVDAQCIKCACVPECTSWAEEEYGGDPSANEALEDITSMCEHEDTADYQCVIDAVSNTFCMGNSCKTCFDQSVAENAVDECHLAQRIVIAFVCYIADLLLGCALGFIAQPSFWYNMLDSDQLAGAGGDSIHTAPPFQRYEDTRRRDTNIADGGTVRAAQTARTSIAIADDTGALSAAVNGVALPTDADFATAADDIIVSSNLGAPDLANHRNDLKNTLRDAASSFQADMPARPSTLARMKNGLKKLIPCLIQTMTGVAVSSALGPAWLGALAAATGSFFGCMYACTFATLGENIAYLVFELVSNCLWQILANGLFSVCFPAHATVQTQDGRTVSMKDLQIGDKVRSGASSFSEVYLFSHKMLSVQANFMEVTTEAEGQLLLSPKHFIHVSRECDNDSSEEMHAVDVQPGMCVFFADKASNRLHLSRVDSVRRVRSAGLYNPFTMNGDIVVDGVLVSAHSEWFLDGIAKQIGMTRFLPSIYQAVLAPARYMYQLVGPEAARVELDKYQEKLNSLTNDNSVVTPYLDLMGSAWEILTSSAPW